MNEIDPPVSKFKEDAPRNIKRGYILKHFKTLGFQTFEQYSFPEIINLCVIRGECPCNCSHCPVGITNPDLREKRFGNSRLSMHLFKKVVDEMAEYRHSTLRFHGVGEPILWEELEDALEYSYVNDVTTWLFTSLITRDKELMGKLAKYCDIIEVSINSYEETDYEKQKGIKEFSLAKNNIKFLNDLVISNNYPTRILVSRVESKNKDYDSKFIEYWKNSGLVDDAFVRSYHDYNKLLADKFKRLKKKISPCLVHWGRFNIDCDGTVVVCFNELFKGEHSDPSIVLGNIKDQSIQEIWKGELLNSIRLAQINKDYSIVSFTNNLPCVNCSSCQFFNTEEKTSEYQIRFVEKRVTNNSRRLNALNKGKKNTT